MDDDRPWLGEEPSARPDVTFRALPVAIGVFFAVAGPIVFAAVARPAGTNVKLVAAGLLAGVVFGVAAGLWVASRRGRVTDRKQL
jgi:ABC-type dipeptide/oligopeptide/nickel transport system permease component